MNVHRTVTDRALEGHGVVQLSPALLIERLQAWSGNARFELVSEESTWASAASHLARLTHPATRLALVPIGEYTVLVNNLKGGSDAVDLVGPLAREARTRTAR